MSFDFDGLVVLGFRPSAAMPSAAHLRLIVKPSASVMRSQTACAPASKARAARSISCIFQAQIWLGNIIALGQICHCRRSASSDPRLQCRIDFLPGLLLHPSLVFSSGAGDYPTKPPVANTGFTSFGWVFVFHETTEFS